MEKEKIVFKGSHPDSLYRVSGTGGAGAGKIARFLRILRWPAALVTVCVALAVFVYFLMPENIMPEAESVNGTYWEESGLIGQSDELNNPDLPTTVHDDELHDSKPPEIDFYDAVNKNGDITTFISTISDAKRPLPVAPVYPIHITPEVQYGNEKADIDKLRNPKTLTGNNKATTVKPHITQKPEKPLEVYFKDALTTVTADESVLRAETMNDLSYNEKQTTKVLENNSQKSTFRVHVEDHETESAPEVDSENDKGFGRREPVNKFTSGHSNNFGISMEDAELMKATTQSSAYKTRVSPTLPTWRDGDDATTKNYPGNVNADVSQCRSTRLSMCRGILPYDLAGAPAKVSGVDATIFLPQIEYLVSTNCSRRVRHFACALLEPECSPLPYPTKKPCFNLCKSIKEGCEGHIPRELAFMFHCNQYSRQNCLDSVAPCFSQEFGCSDGTCIPREWLCDGSQDCPSGEDEVTCRDCLKTEYRCRTGECIQRRWLCDGYSDCPDSDDETEQACRPYATGEGPLAPGEVSLATGEGPEQGEESAGSAPAPAVRRPNRIQQNHRSSSVYSIGEGDSSKELLMTSDSNNALKRNYTRRPSPSRLIPYNRHFKTPQKVESNDKSPETEPVTQKAISDSTEDVNVDELGFYGDIKKGNGTTPSIFQSSKQETMAITDPDYATDAEQPTPPTFLDKTVNKLERVINGAEILKKVLTKQLSEREEEVPKSASIERAEEYPSVQTAHISPCPSGELRCVDGRCITLAQLCDGTVDCSDHADEENCYT